MRRQLLTRATVFVGLAIAGIAAITATDASAKRIRLGGSRPVVSVVPIPGSASAAAATAATATVAGSKAQEAEQAAAIQRAQAKLAAESGTGAKTTTSTLVSEQVNSSAGDESVVCIAGCYK